MKQRLTAFKPNFKQAIAPTVMSTLIFFLTYFLFGADNMVIGPIVTLAFLRFFKMQAYYESMIKNFVVFFAMAILGYFAALNPVLCIVINALALFWIAYFLIDEFEPDNYFPAGMALLFFQISPTQTPAALGTRLLALLATFVVVIIFVFCYSRITRRCDPLPRYIRQGFDNCRRQIALCEAYQRAAQAEEEGTCTTAYADRESYEDLLHLREQLIEITKKICDEIYSYNRATIRTQSKTNWYCRFVQCFQVFNYLTLNFKDEENLAQAQAICRDFQRQFAEVTPTSDYHRLRFRIRKPDMRSFRLRFGLRLAITLTPCLAVAFITDSANVYWLVVFVFFMMIPFTDHTFARIRQRVFGTVGGVVICLVLFTLFESFAARTVIMIAANFLLYGATGYGVTVAYLTCSEMALQTLNEPAVTFLAYRLLFTLIGAGIALAANLLIFPIRLEQQIDYVAELMERIHREMDADDVPQTEDVPREKEREVDQRIIWSFLLNRRLQEMCEALPLDEVTFDYKAFEKKHMFLMEQYLMRQFLRKE